ncbi:rho guanine nucleotide exchange factor 3-like [Oppia nitens]|uniref:rho guanine nucleotide exchange factor 3-like n=1 Tax=Oppia nitens TaxID=1686743 RepID=UPI0023DA6141|nr:rho guanine nucleotide exchange factor 3-like [Oppia nitens]
MNDSNNSLRFKSMIGLKGHHRSRHDLNQSSFISLTNISISSTFSLSSLKSSSLKKMRRFLTTTKLTRNKSSVLSPKNLNNELEAKNKQRNRKEVNNDSNCERIRPSISSPQIVCKKSLPITNRIISTPISRNENSNSRMFCRQSSKLWIESIPQEVVTKFKEAFSSCEYKRQEAIFELFSGEMDMCYDLGLIEATYQNSLIHLAIIDESEAFQIFGDLHALHSVHSSLVQNLEAIRDKNGIFGSVGKVLMDWTPKLEVYENYCSNQRAAKQILEMKIKCDKRMNDFLQRCLESPFSRRLDLWAFLDVPRNRLVKYPLLLRAIKKYTSETSFDYKAIECAVNLMEKIISQVDYRMGEEECKVFVDKIDFDRSCDSNVCLIEAKAIICSGTLRNSRGTKVLCILFDTCFVLTRHNNDSGAFVLYRQPILIGELQCDSGAAVKMGNTLNRTLNGPVNPNKSFVFRVYSSQRDITYTLQAKDANNFKLWSNKLRQVLDKYTIKQMTNNPTIPKIMSKTVIFKEPMQTPNKSLKKTEESPRKKIKFHNENDLTECYV